MDKQDSIVTHVCATALGFLIGGVLIGDCRAADLHVQIHGASKHTSQPQGYEFNERNLGGGVRLQLNDRWGVQVGAYKNSYRRNTKYALFQYTPIDLGNVRAGVFGGYASGYAYKVPGVAGAMATWQVSGRLSTTVRYVPPVGKGTSGVFAFELGWKL